jgi:radical SAM superfamily enzyme YgiQ (UPF0313 family)
MRILLISPADKNLRVRRLGDRPKVSWMYRSGRSSLLAVAAATPEEHDIQFLDEYVEPIDFDQRADVVGVSFSTPLAPRAYEIGDEFRRKGVPVVFGGYHSSVLPDEALEHCDSVCVGEAEPVWERMLRDLGQQRLNRSYHSVARTDLARWRPLRRVQWDSDAHEILNVVTAGRGCPHTCDFCSVTEFYGNSYRHRPVEEIINELRALDEKFVLFGDDNIIADRLFARELFTAMAPLKIRWMGQSTISIAEDPDLVKLAVGSGCSGLFIGLESLLRENLELSGKVFSDTGKYEEYIARLTDAGIAVMGGFVFGFDNDDYRIFDRSVKFIRKTRIIPTQIAVLTPFPGTKLHERLTAEKRIFDCDWRRYDCRHVVFYPKRMTAVELQDGVDWTIGETYSFRALAMSAWDLLPALGPMGLLRCALPVNLAIRQDLRVRNSPPGFRKVSLVPSSSFSS